MIRARESLAILLILYGYNTTVLADKIYSCKNASGKMVFQDSPCAENEKQVSSKTINPAHSSAGTINRAICEKSIGNIHKYLMPKMINLLSIEERKKLMSENIAKCMKGHTEKDYQEILCLSRANSNEAVTLCIKAPS